MPSRNRRYVIITLTVEVDDELALQDAGYRKHRQSISGEPAMPDEAYQTVDYALNVLAIPEVPELPGARVTDIGIKVRDHDPSLPPGVEWPS